MPPRPTRKHAKASAQSSAADRLAETLAELIAALDVPPHLEKRARELLRPLADKKEFLKGDEVDEILRCSRRKRSRLVHAGFLPEIRPGGGNPVYLRLDVGRLVWKGLR